MLISLPIFFPWQILFTDSSISGVMNSQLQEISNMKLCQIDFNRTGSRRSTKQSLLHTRDFLELSIPSFTNLCIRIYDYVDNIRMNQFVFLLLKKYKILNQSNLIY